MQCPEQVSRTLAKKTFAHIQCVNGHLYRCTGMCRQTVHINVWGKTIYRCMGSDYIQVYRCVEAGYIHVLGFRLIIIQVHI